jgi:hypothetical protein
LVFFLGGVAAWATRVGRLDRLAVNDTVPEDSFLATDEETSKDLTAVGLEILSFRDTTQENLTAQSGLWRKIEAEGRPALGMHVLVGDRLRQQRDNSHRALLDGRARMVAIVARKPG